MIIDKNFKQLHSMLIRRKRFFYRSPAVERFHKRYIALTPRRTLLTAFTRIMQIVLLVGLLTLLFVEAFFPYKSFYFVVGIIMVAAVIMYSIFRVIVWSKTNNNQKMALSQKASSSSNNHVNIFAKDSTTSSRFTPKKEM